MSMELEAVERWYPGARTGFDFAQAQLDRLRAAGGQARTTVLAACLCADDLIASVTDLPRRLAGPFQLGGLAGLPHTGRTGMTAFAHHIPTGGSAFVLYGPHLGFDGAGRPGSILRPGQQHEGPCCGALLLALRHLADGAPPPDALTDPQQAALERVLAPHAAELRAAEQPVIAAIDLLYACIHEQIHGLLTALRGEFHGARIVTCGVVMIHLGQGHDDRLQVRHEAVLAG